MIQKNHFIKVIGVSTVIALSNITSSSAQAPDTIPQESDAQETTEQLKPAQAPVSDIEKLNSSEDSLSLPTTPEEVKTDAQQAITLEQALEISLKNNKDIQEAKLQVERAESEVKQQKAALYPTFDLTSGLSYSNDLFLDSISQQQLDQRNIDDSVSGRFNFQGGLGLEYDIYNGGQRGAAIRASEKQLRNSELDLERILEVARFETSRDYYNLQNSDAQVEIRQASVKDSEQTLKDAELRKKAGLGTKFEVLQGEVELAQAEQQLTTAIANQDIARRQLAETLSVSHKADLATADKIKEAGAWDLELPETIILAFKNREELQQSLLQKDISQEQRTVALSQGRPNLRANADYTLSDNFEDDFDTSDNYQVGLSLQWRLFDGGAVRAGAAQAEKDGEIAETQFANQRNQIRFAVEQAFLQLKSNENNISTTTKGVDLATESLRLARLRFKEGVGTQTEVIDAQTELTRARGDLLNSITEYNQSYADLTRQVSSTPNKGSQENMSGEESQGEELPDMFIPEDQPQGDTPTEELQQNMPSGEPQGDMPDVPMPEDAPNQQGQK